MGRGPTRSTRGAGNPGQQLVQFTLDDAQRIADAVSQVERSRRQPKASTLPRRVGGGGVTLCIFTGGWWKDTTKVIKLQADTNATTIALNVFAHIASKPGDRRCAIISSGGTAPLLIAAECV